MSNGNNSILCNTFQQKETASSKMTAELYLDWIVFTTQCDTVS